MAARKRASTDTSPTTEQSQPKETKPQAPSPAEPPIAPPKSGVILKLSLLFMVPYFYLIFHHYKIESELKRSILINAGISLAGYFAAVKLIPVASRYVLRRNLFGYDINKKGTPQGTVKVWAIFFFLVEIVKLICVKFVFLVKFDSSFVIFVLIESDYKERLVLLFYQWFIQKLDFRIFMPFPFSFLFSHPW